MSELSLPRIGRTARGQDATPWPVDQSLKLARDLWAECHFVLDPQCRTRAAVDPVAPAHRRRFQLPSGPHELVCWLPGPHPRYAVWWEELSLWVLLRRCA
jgi:hypothetical protein